MSDPKDDYGQMEDILKPRDCWHSGMKRKWPMVMQPTGRLLLVFFWLWELEQEGRLAKTRIRT